MQSYLDKWLCIALKFFCGIQVIVEFFQVIADILSLKFNNYS
jgi:hypothetical protein